MPPLRAAALASCLLLIGCGSAPTRGGRTADGTAVPSPTVLRELPAGTVVRLGPTTIATSGDPVSATFVDALLREALRLSTRFDVAADLEDMPDARFTLQVRIDAAASLMTLALVDGVDDAPATPIAAASYADRPLPRAIDELAWQARRALGEDVPDEPMSCARIYSASPTCVRETEAALLDENRGLHGSRRERLDRARRSDPGCAMTISVQSAAALFDRQFVEAAQLAEGALRTLPGRTSPTTAHRLRRALWLARAAAASDPAEARHCDEQLLEIAGEFLEQRPFDPQGRYSRALANANLGNFEDAAKDLRELRARWPGVPWVAYHLAFAEIALGRPDAALDQLDVGARRLSPAWTFLPRALALYEAGHHDELDRMLERMAGRHRGRTDDRTLHELRRALAAHAMLLDRPADAARNLLDDLEWLRERPSILDQHTADLLEDGEALLVLGRDDELRARLAAIRALPTDLPNTSLAVTFLTGRLAIGRDDDAVERAVRELRSAGWQAAAARLEAARALAAGDPASAVADLQRSMLLDDDPRSQAELVVALRAAGRNEEADRLAATVRDRLGKLHLRGPLEHPLMGPGFALAWQRCGGAVPVSRGA